MYVCIYAPIPLHGHDATQGQFFKAIVITYNHKRVMGENGERDGSIKWYVFLLNVQKLGTSLECQFQPGIVKVSVLFCEEEKWINKQNYEMTLLPCNDLSISFVLNFQYPKAIELWPSSFFHLHICQPIYMSPSSLRCVLFQNPTVIKVFIFVSSKINGYNCWSLNFSFICYSFLVSSFHFDGATMNGQL